MCMNNVRPVKGEDLPAHAWKVCWRPSKWLPTAVDHFTGPYSCTARQDEVWMKAEQEPTNKSVLTHEPGFHVFATQEGAQAYTKWVVAATGRINGECYVTRVGIRGPAFEGRTTWARLLCYSVAEIRFPKREEEVE
jgi:hypothetical protein